MALTKEVTINKIECVGKHRTIQIQYLTRVKEDDKQISSSYTRRAFDCGRLDNIGNFIETDISGETDEIKAICNASWTDDVKNSYKEHLKTKI